MRLNNDENLIVICFIILVLVVVINSRLNVNRRPMIISLNKFTGKLNKDNIILDLKNSDGSINVYGPTIFQD